MEKEEEESSRLERDIIERGYRHLSYRGIKEITCKGASAPGLELSLSTGLLRRTFSSSSVGSSIITGGGLGFLPATFILIVRASGRGTSFFSFRLLRGAGGESSSSSLPDSTVSAGRFLGEGA